MQDLIMRRFDIIKNMRSKHCAADGNPKLGGKTLLRTSLGETISLVRCFSPVYCFQPDFSFRPQLQQNWSPLTPVWATLASSSFANLVDGVVFTI